MQTVVEIFYCPTRREARLYPAVTGHTRQPRETNQVKMVARNDYASNSGDTFLEFTLGPTTLEQGSTFKWPNQRKMTGLMHVRSQVKIKQVTDGTSKTYFVGEKYLNPLHYTNGQAPGDNEAVYMGAGQDLNRWTAKGFPPIRDKAGVGGSKQFGSAHASGLNMMFCDGSVRHIPFRIDPEMHRRFGNRKDGLTADTTVLE
jgi:prepilin-type processing-associated H-X9-DG protein